MKLLLTGTSGFLASRVRDFLAPDADLTVLAPSHAALDVASYESCTKWFAENRPDAVIHLAAMSDIADCDRNPALSHRINADGPFHLARCAKECGMTGRFLFASSDQVYTANHTADRLNRETDELAPENLYGREKLEAEERVLAVLPNAVAMRLDWMFDLKPGKSNYLKNMIRAVRERTVRRVPVNELRAQTYAYEVAANMKKMLFSDAPGGVYNFGGPAAGNSYETALCVTELIGEALRCPVGGLILPGTLDTPRSLAMDQTKLNAAGIGFNDTVGSAKLCLEREGNLI